MLRRALLIATPADGLPGARKDLDNYSRFLRSTGGAWEAGEVTKLVDPTLEQVKKAVTALNGSDFTFVSFSGHGFCAQDGTTHVNVKGGTLSEHDLNSGARRQVLILDACRALLEDHFIKAAAILERLAKSDDFRRRLRQHYEAAILRAEEGRTTAYACGINQSAMETSTNGGDFSFALMQAGVTWAETMGSDAVLSIREAFAIAKKSVRKPQEPVLSEGRRINSFPFAVR